MGWLTPRLGAGVGAAWESGSFDQTELLLHASLGIVVRVHRRAGLLPEGRQRSVDP